MYLMNEPDPDTLVPNEETSQSTDRGLDQAGTLGTLARLLVAGALLGRDAIGSGTAPETEAREEGPLPPADGQVTDVDGLVVTVSSPPPAASPRHLLIGALFDTGEQIERRASSVLRLASKTASPAVRWARRSRLASPARNRLDTLSARGEARVRRWVERGMIEEQRSRALLNQAVSRAANSSLDRVVESPQVHGLVGEIVQAQGQSLSRRFLEELRALGVRGDQAVTRLARRIVRHPRKEVPPFPRAVQAPLPVLNIPSTLEGRTAGFVSRLFAFLVDVILISIIVRGTGWLLEDIRIVTGATFNLPFLTSGGDGMAPIYVTVGGGLFMSAAYFVFFWTVAGITPGKALLGVRVVTRDGGRVSLVRSMIRLFGYTLSTLFYGLGYLWIAIDNRREAWHDKIARTAVIYAWDARPSDRSLVSAGGITEDPGTGLPPGD